MKELKFNDMIAINAKGEVDEFGDYHVHPSGWIYSDRRNKILIPRVNVSNGYLQVMLYDGNNNPKQFYIHRLVGIAFIPNPDNKPQINHKNKIRHDNRVDNLEWVTHQENMDHKNSVIAND